jgi:glucosamine-6-phosphate deaminase
MQPLHETRIDRLPVSIYRSNEEMGQAAAAEAVQIMRQAIAERGVANIIVATGNSQLTFLRALRDLPGIDWPKVNVFHLDEYVGIDPNHRASFPLFLRRELVDHVQPGGFFPVLAATEDAEAVCRAYEAELRGHPADLVAMGIGENGHIAFNDPPYADFDDPVWVKVVRLDEVSRRQQVGEGHFASLDEVPTHAVTLTIPALLAPRQVLCIVPESRKAWAVKQALHGPISEDCPASILRRQPHAHLYLDADAAAQAFPS